MSRMILVRRRILKWIIRVRKRMRSRINSMRFTSNCRSRVIRIISKYL